MYLTKSVHMKAFCHTIRNDCILIEATRAHAVNE